VAPARPDGNIWFTETADDTIGKVVPGRSLVLLAVVDRILTDRGGAGASWRDASHWRAK
jgi:hypothetical protein